MVAGRGTEGRQQASVVTTNASAAITGPAGTFNEEDVGAAITHTGITGGGTILSVASGTAATLAANAAPGGTATATIAGKPDQYGFFGWSPESDAESEVYTIAGGAGAAAPSVVGPTVDMSTWARRSKG